MKAKGRVHSASLARGIGVGVIASLVGTVAMDLVMVVEFVMMGLPVLTYLDLIGSVFGGGIPIGTVVHVFLGALLGLIFVVPVLTIDVLHIDTVKRGAVLGFLLGLASIVACVPFAILVDLPITEVLSFMAIPHLVWGIVFGVVVGHRSRSVVAAGTRDPEHDRLSTQITV